MALPRGPTSAANCDQVAIVERGVAGDGVPLSDALSILAGRARLSLLRSVISHHHLRRLQLEPLNVVGFVLLCQHAYALAHVLLANLPFRTPPEFL